MMNEVEKSLPVDIAVCAAAVSDFKPKFQNKEKLKKNKSNFSNLKLEKNQDILEFISKNNKRPKIVVGFSAETKNLIKNSKIKIQEKYCDLIVANEISAKNPVFNSDYNKVSIIDTHGNVLNISKNKKSIIANKVVKIILEKLLINDRNFN